jgi:hypothetical protein
MVWGYVSPQMGLLTAMDLGETSSALRPRLNSSVTRGLETAETLSREAEGGGQWIPIPMIGITQAKIWNF